MLIPTALYARRWTSKGYKCSRKISEALSAIELYNNDIPNDKIEEVPPGKAIFIYDKLQKKGFLKDSPKCPVCDLFPYSIKSDGDINLVCELHGLNGEITNNNVKKANSYLQSQSNNLDETLASSIGFSIALTIIIFVFVTIAKAIKNATLPIAEN